MSKRKNILYHKIENSLSEYEKERHKLQGIIEEQNRSVLVWQFVDSIRRVEFVKAVCSRPVSPKRANPANSIFDPIRAAAYHSQNANIDEAFWMVFLFVHFSKHPKSGYQCIQSVYGKLSQGGLWSWNAVSKNPTKFRYWLHENAEEIKSKGLGCKFGNHRKYQSPDAFAHNGTGDAIDSYVNWVGPTKSHIKLFNSFQQKARGDSRVTFGLLYDSMSSVQSFGRLAKFDYLTMKGKLGLAEIEPPSAYLESKNGPAQGVKLLFYGNNPQTIAISTLNELLIEIDEYLDVGMQVLEDALCNWQKSPDRLIRFRG